MFVPCSAFWMTVERNVSTRSAIAFSRWPVLRDRSELGGRACPIDPHRRGRHDARRRGAVFLVELAIAATSCWPRLNENSGMMSGTRIAGAAGRPSPASGFLAILGRRPRPRLVPGAVV
jgi:hypothetical protein